MQKKILITGINGFVGTRLAHYLSEDPGMHVYGLSSNPKPEIIPKLNLSGLYSYDDQSFWNQHSFDAVVHCAGKAHDLKNASHPEEYTRINVDLTKSIFNAYDSAPGNGKFIFLSSVKAVADEVADRLDEDAIPNPKTPYGLSKLQAEEFLSKQSQNSEKKVFIFRPCVIYGPGNKGNLNLLYQFVKRRLPWPLGSFSNQRSFLYIDNLAFIIREVIERDIPPETYNIADDGYLSTNDLIRMIGEAAGVEGKILNTPKPLVNLAAKTGDALHLPLNSERLRKLTENYRVDNQKIRKAIGKELPYSIREGLYKTFKRY